jgi:excisionase family DNA binding protein
MKDLSDVRNFLVDLIQPIVDDSIRRALKETQQPKEPVSDRLMDIKEASQYLGLALPTIYEKTSRNEIPFLKRGKKLYFRKDDLLKWLEEGRRKTKKDIDREAEEYLRRKGGKR